MTHGAIPAHNQQLRRSLHNTAHDSLDNIRRRLGRELTDELGDPNHQAEKHLKISSFL
jgi:hypothetical protein